MFRSEPKDLEEMYKWGMISRFVFEKVLSDVGHLSQAEQIAYANGKFGTQTWRFGKDHFKEYVEEQGIDISKEFELNDWIAHVCKTSGGRASIPAAHEFYLEVFHKGFVPGRFVLVKNYEFINTYIFECIGISPFRDTDVHVKLDDGTKMIYPIKDVIGVFKTKEHAQSVLDREKEYFEVVDTHVREQQEWRKSIYKLASTLDCRG